MNFFFILIVATITLGTLLVFALLTLITYMLNFSDQSHFSNSFKKIYGMTPREFRKTIQ